MKDFIYFTLFSLFTSVTIAQCPSGPGSGCNGSGTGLNLHWVGTDGLSSGIYTIRILSNKKTIANNIPLVIEK